MIDISKADKAEVLMRLVNYANNCGVNAHPVAVALAEGVPKITHEQANSIMGQHNRLSFDYVMGKSVQVDLSGDTFEEWLYDRDNGQGAARRALEDVAGVVFSPAS